MATEAFTNVNGTELLTHSANWNAGNMLSSDFVIDSNAVRTPFNRNISLFAYYSGTFSNDQYAEATITQVGTDEQRMGLCVRASAGNGYVVQFDTNQFFVEKHVAYAYTLLDNVAITLATNDLIRLEVSGTTLTVKVNGVQVYTTTDSSLASGAPGVAGQGAAASGTYTLLDSWTGADIVVTVPQFFQYAWPHQLHVRR